MTKSRKRTGEETAGFMLGCFAVFAVFALVMLPVRNPVYMRWLDEMSLFDGSNDSIAAMLDYPGGLLQHAGAWLTQLLHRPWLGACVLVALWWSIAFLSIKAFRLKGVSTLWAFVTPTALMVSLIGIDESLLTVYSQGFAFSPTIGILTSLVILNIYNLAGRWRWAVALIAPTMFPWVGFYALLGWLLCAITEATAGRHDYKGIASIVAGLAVTIAVPLLYYRFWNGNWAEQATIYLKGLPEFMPDAGHVGEWLPLIVAAASPTLLAMLQRVMTQHATSRGNVIAAGCVAGIMALWTIDCGTKPERWRAMMLMQEYMADCKWTRIMSVAENLRETPESDLMAIARLAALKSGASINDLPEADNRELASDIVNTALVTVPVSYHAGRANLGYRWAMEHTVKFGKRAYFIKYMMKCCLVNGELNLARRYNAMLGATMSHSDWARRYRRFIDNPELMKSDAEFMSIPPESSKDTFFNYP